MRQIREAELARVIPAASPATTRLELADGRVRPNQARVPEAAP